ncbi:translocation protein SEC63 homolog [Tetranychus urticae]|nr:translocation protein SEC63 homolog [Tetranychus urticae]
MAPGTGSKFQYDESGGTFFYFLLSFLALVVIPCTYYLWPYEKKKDKDKLRDINACHCGPCAIKSNYLESREPWKNVKNQAIKAVLLLGWIAMILTAYKVVNLQHDYVVWDPFEILGIDPSSSTAEIKKAYRRLSLIYHPDKETGDEKKFLLLTKAYAALTDDEARKNWQLYGNPDGPGATSFGIALPSWIVEKENSILVLGLYALVFMVALPTAVGIWWYRSVKYGADQVLLDTTSLYYYFIHKTHQMPLKRVLMIIAASCEFHRRQNSEIIERPSDNLEVNQLIKELPYINDNNREKPLFFPYSLKARALLHAHLSRMKLPPTTLEIDKMIIVKKCPLLIQEFVQCAGQLTILALTGRISRKPHKDTLENAMKLCRLVVQALWDNKSPLLQLPHITEDMLRFFNTRKRGTIRSIQQLATMKEDERRSLLRSLTDEHYHNIIQVMSRMPFIELDVKTEVVDDEDSTTITAGAIVTVTVTLIRHAIKVLIDKSRAEDYDPDKAEREVNGSEDIANSDLHAPESPQAKKQSQWVKNRGKKKVSKQQKKKTKPPMKPAARQLNVQSNNSAAAAEKILKESKPASKLQERKEAGDVTEEEISQSGEETDVSKSDVEPITKNEVKTAEKAAPTISTSRGDDDDDDEEWNKCQQKLFKREKILETKSKRSHSVHCPYFPEDKQEYWWIYMVDRKKIDLIATPILVTNLVDEEQIEFKITAPHKPGIYSYWIIVKSDSYVDCDVSQPVKLDVKEAKIIADNNIWDLSDEEEVTREDDSAVEDSDLAASSDEEESDD